MGRPQPEEIVPLKGLSVGEVYAGACETGYSSVGITVAKRSTAIDPPWSASLYLSCMEIP